MKSWHAIDWLLFLAFVIWSAAGLTFILLQISPATIEGWKVPPDLKTFVSGCLTWGDPVLILLAFANTHLHAARQWSAGVARRWALVIVPITFGIEWAGSNFGIPFGDYRYTANFGPTLLGVPLAIPLAWHVVLTNTLFVVRALAPNFTLLPEALITGFLCTVYDFVLEPFATQVKSYWVWTDKSVPPLNYVAWFVISALLVRILAPALGTRYRLDPRPWLILGLTLAIFIAGRLSLAAH
jgi:putative membrane protein